MNGQDKGGRRQEEEGRRKKAEVLNEDC